MGVTVPTSIEGNESRRTCHRSSASIEPFCSRNRDRDVKMPGTEHELYRTKTDWVSNARAVASDGGAHAEDMNGAMRARDVRGVADYRQGSAVMAIEPTPSILG